jgi:hypothetical protein
MIVQLSRVNTAPEHSKIHIYNSRRMLYPLGTNRYVNANSQYSLTVWKLEWVSRQIAVLLDLFIFAHIFRDSRLQWGDDVYQKAKGIEFLSKHPSLSISSWGPWSVRVNSLSSKNEPNCLRVAHISAFCLSVISPNLGLIHVLLAAYLIRWLQVGSHAEHADELPCVFILIDSHLILLGFSSLSSRIHHLQTHWEVPQLPMH